MHTFTQTNTHTHTHTHGDVDISTGLSMLADVQPLLLEAKWPRGVSLQSVDKRHDSSGRQVPVKLKHSRV